MQAREAGAEKGAAEEGRKKVEEFPSIWTGAGTRFDAAVVGALLGVLITCIVNWAGHWVTHFGAQAAHRLARDEKRAAVAIRSLAIARRGSVIRGEIANVGASVASAVKVWTQNEAEAFGTVGAGERIAFELAIAQTGDIILRFSYDDFAGRSYVEGHKLIRRRGRLVLTSIEA